MPAGRRAAWCRTALSCFAVPEFPSRRIAMKFLDLGHVEVFLLGAPFEIFRAVVVRVIVEMDNHSPFKWRRPMKCFANSPMNLDVAEEFGVDIAVGVASTLHRAANTAPYGLGGVKPETAESHWRMARRQENSPVIAGHHTFKAGHRFPNLRHAQKGTSDPSSAGGLRLRLSRCC